MCALFCSQQVIQVENEKQIRATVCRLQIDQVVQLVQELSRLAHGNARSAQNIMKWLNIVLSTHSSHLTTVNDNHIYFYYTRS